MENFKKVSKQENVEKNHESIVNAMILREGIPEELAKKIKLKDKTLCLGDEVLGVYSFFPGIDFPLFRWSNVVVEQFTGFKPIENEKGKVLFRLSLCCHGTPALIISGELATRKVHSFIHRMLTNRTTDPCYQLSQDSGAFFQSGSHDPNCKFFMVEFWRPEGAQAFVDFFNEYYWHYVPIF